MKGHAVFIKQRGINWISKQKAKKGFNYRLKNVRVWRFRLDVKIRILLKYNK